MKPKPKMYMNKWTGHRDTEKGWRKAIKEWEKCGDNVMPFEKYILHRHFLEVEKVVRWEPVKK